MALRTPPPGEPHGDGDGERAAPPVHGEYLKMIIDMSTSRDVQDAVDDPDDFQAIAPSPSPEPEPEPEPGPGPGPEPEP